MAAVGGYSGQNRLMKAHFNRRKLLQGLAGLAGSMALPATTASAGEVRSIAKKILSSGTRLPVIGLGSWLTFDAAPVQSRRDNARQVMQAFFDLGGGMIDSSPMYSSSQSVIGEGLARIRNKQNLFSATTGLCRRRWYRLRAFKSG